MCTSTPLSSTAAKVKACRASGRLPNRFRTLAWAMRALTAVLSARADACASLLCDVIAVWSCDWASGSLLLLWLALVPLTGSCAGLPPETGSCSAPKELSNNDSAMLPVPAGCRVSCTAALLPEGASYWPLRSASANLDPDRAPLLAEFSCPGAAPLYGAAAEPLRAASESPAAFSASALARAKACSAASRSPCLCCATPAHHCNILNLFQTGPSH